MTEELATPPRTGGRAARFGFIRSEQERKIAGVSTAFGRATGTDPLLWRVLLAVLTVFAGAGLVLYLGCWLVFPAEGDETSPAGALLSAKTSSTSKVITLLLALGAGLLGVITMISTHGRPFLVFALVAALVVVLARRRSVEPPPPPAPSSPPSSPEPTRTDEYQAPFAPGGPYANRTLELPVEPPPPTPTPPAPKKPPPRRSALGLVTFSLVVIELGLAAILGMLGVPVHAGTAVAVALLLCGGGLLLGTWWGRGRGLIWLGIALAAGLAWVSIFDGRPTVPFTDDGFYAETVDTIPRDVSTVMGNFTLDVSQVDFDDGDKIRVAVNIWLGSGTILVPDDVDIVVTAHQPSGEIAVDGETVDSGCRDCRFPGDDGKGGGTLVIDAAVESGQLEVER